MPPNVDLVLTVRITSKFHSKAQSHEAARKAERQYAKLLDTLSQAGLHATGRRGENHNHVLLLVSCPERVMNRLVKCERHSDFLYGLPTASVPMATDFEIKPLSPADRLRIVYSYVTSTLADGGLGIHPGSPDWEFIESVMVLHDREFNDAWIRSWTTRRITPALLEKTREQLGDAVALYFIFLSSYTKALIFPAVLGIMSHLFGTSYSPVYSILLVLWSIGFVEWWRVRERLIAMRNGTGGSFRVEKRRAHHIAGFTWWNRELRMAASVPVILLFIVVLIALLTGIFIFEAFVTRLYTGPGHQYISFGPTILFVVFVPRLLALYQAFAVRSTNWENHAHQSKHNASLTLKTFALSAIVAYLGLALSAFVYVPFGEGLMNFIQVCLFEGMSAVGNMTVVSTGLNETVVQKTSGGPRIWDTDRSNSRSKLSSSRLRDQMFVFTVTNQVINAFLEIGLPFILRGIDFLRGGKRIISSGKKKRVVFEDETKREGEGKEEREFLENVRREVALPEYTLFEDYSEMVTQFGYVALWSTIWPLASVMALLNNFLELRSDAIKIAVHYRRPIPTRTDTIGPWLESLTFLTWLSALTNSALVYLYRPRAGTESLLHQTLFSSTPGEEATHSLFARRRQLLVSALLIALVASHGYIVVRGVVRHVMERAMWTDSVEVAEAARSEKAVKESYLRSLSGNEAHDQNDEGIEGESPAFWARDEGMEEIQKLMKEA